MGKPYKSNPVSKVTLIIILFFSSLVSARIIYVDDDAAGSNNGSSWENAYIYLQDALYEAITAEKPLEIRVAQGIYKPDQVSTPNMWWISTGDNSASFELLNGVTISGGFKGSESSGDERNIELYPSILSGDLYNDDSEYYDPNDIVNDYSFLDNSYHIVTASDTDSSSVLDGFTITAGMASYYDDYDFILDSKSRGGGIYINSTIDEYNSDTESLLPRTGPVISNCTFRLNAAYEGGAIYSNGSDPNITNCIFIENISNYLYNYSGNFVGGRAGAILNINSNTTLTNCDFINNYAGSGAAIYNISDSNGIFTNCTFLKNIANSNDITIFNYGGAIINERYSNPILNNCTFEENYAKTDGGAICSRLFSNPNITNCKFINNSTTKGGGAISNSYSDPNFTFCTFSGNNSREGGAIINTDSHPTFYSCVFSNNLAYRYGGVMQNYRGNVLFKNCILSGNTSYYTCGALFNAGGYIKAENCTATGNSAFRPGFFAYNSTIDFEEKVDGVLVVIYSRGNFEILNSIIWNGENAIYNDPNSNMMINYSDIQKGIMAIDDPNERMEWGVGNIDTDPLFVQPGFWVNVNDPNIIVEPFDQNAFWLEGDYHLQSTAGHYDPNSQIWILDDVNSPCLDAGDPNSLFDNELLPNGGRINMGVYGNTSQASLSQESLAANKEPDDS